MAEIDFSAPTISYEGNTQDELEGCALEETPYYYNDVSATDSHNGAVDVCERIWYNNGYGLDLCCTAAERSSMTEGCAAFGFGDEEPIACESAYDATCSGVDTTIVSTWMIQYTAMDYSENTADPIDVTVVIVDTTPPECPLPSYGDYAFVEKCTYFEVPEIDCLDCVDLFIESVPSFSYTSDFYGDACEGGEWTDGIDEDTPGNYCIEYGATDAAGNAATPVHVTVEVRDTTPPYIGLEIPETTLECSNCGGVTCEDADPIADTNNLPCLDYPAAEDDCEELFDATYVNSFTVDWSTNDGYNSASTTQSITIVDTTPPTITCPNDIVLVVHEEVHEGESTRDDTCDNGDNPSDNRDVCDSSTIGVYTVTYNAMDNSYNAASCNQLCTVEDPHDPECELVGDEYVNIEACTGSYTELGIICTDNYDVDINSKTTTSWGYDSYPEYEGSFTVEYGACDQSDNCAVTLTRYVTVTDTTAPVVSTNGDLIYAEASVFDVDAGSSATDECCDDLSVSFEAEAIDFTHCASFNFGITSEYWANVYGDEATEFIYYCGETIDDADAAAAAANAAQNDDELAGACSAYTVTYAWTDCSANNYGAGNTGYASQTVWTIDTIAPTLSQSTYLASVKDAAAGNAGALALVAGVALFAGLFVGRKTGQRSSYMPL